MAPAAPAAVIRFSRLGVACPRERAATITAKKACGTEQGE